MSTRAKKATAAGAAVGVVAMTVTYLTIPWEGTRTHAYWDNLGKVWTICNGDTLDVRKGMVRSDAQCAEMTQMRMENDFHKPLQRCIPGFDKKPIGWQGAALDEAWNIGAPAFCRSTAAARARDDDIPGSCKAMTWFTRAGGKIILGLKKRRENGDASRIGEYELCTTK